MTGKHRPLVLAALLLLAGCGTAGTAPPRPTINLSGDQAAHPAAHNEWWYVVGHLAAPHRRFGFEVSLIKITHLTPPGSSATVDLYRADVAITDVTGNRYHQRITYYFPQSARLSSTGLSVHLGPNSLEGSSPANMRLHASLPSGSIDLHLVSRSAPLMEGGTGYIPFVNGHSYYYSLTNVAASGTIRLGSHRYQSAGIAWLDHQWGNWTWGATPHWTWMALQLDNGVQLSTYSFPFKPVPIAGASLLVNGHSTAVTGTRITSTGAWQSPASGVRYPSGWVVTIPQFRSVLHITPDVKDQELYLPGVLRTRYWEGASLITGTFGGRPVKGQAYVELMGVD